MFECLTYSNITTTPVFYPILQGFEYGTNTIDLHYMYILNLLIIYTIVTKYLIKFKLIR